MLQMFVAVVLDNYATLHAEIHEAKEGQDPPSLFVQVRCRCRCWRQRSLNPACSRSRLCKSPPAFAAAWAGGNDRV